MKTGICHLKSMFVFLTTLMLITNSAFGQAPDKMSYQAVIRDASNQLLVNQNIGMQISILQGSVNGTAVYVERHFPTSNANGLVSLEIGTGTVVSGDFNSIDWSNGPYFIKTETDPAGGSNYSITGTSQLLSVPYALYARDVENDRVDDADADPTNEYQNIQGSGLSGTVLTIGIENGSSQSVDLAPLQDGTGTDDQNIENLGLSGTVLTVGIEDGNSQSVDLAPLQDGTGTDDQNIENLGLSGTVLTVGIENGNSQSVDLVSLDNDWKRTGNAGTVDTLHFIGTTDDAALNFRVNNSKAGRIGTSSDGSLFLGYQAGQNDDLSDNQNTFLGYQSGQANTTGSFNNANGYRSLYSNTTGSYNTANGYQSLYYNIGGSYNTATGNQSLYYNTGGNYNTANGQQSLYSNMIGTFNTANGFRSLYSNTTGSYNTAHGYQSLYYNTTGSGNMAIGDRALHFNTTGSINTANGNQSLYYNTTGSYNTANGFQSLYYNKANSYSVAIGYRAMYYADNRTTGRTTYNTAIGVEALRGSSTPSSNTGLFNTATGYQSLYSNTTGGYNTANGNRSLYSNTTGFANTANGNQSLYSNTTGFANTANGNQSLFKNTIGVRNTAIGDQALFSNVSGNNNTAVGKAAFYSFTSYSNSTALGYGTLITASNQVRIGHSSVTSIGGYANWTNVSDARFKKDVRENVGGLDFIMKLRPVTYRLDMDAIARFNNTPDSLRLPESERLKAAELQVGFIAQEVEAAALETGFDFHGVDKPKNEHDFYGLRYAEFVAPMVKAMQEQQALIERQQEMIVRQQESIEEMKQQLEDDRARMKELESKIELILNEKAGENANTGNQAEIIRKQEERIHAPEKEMEVLKERNELSPR